jgi:hypothetical protein
VHTIFSFELKSLSSYHLTHFPGLHETLFKRGSGSLPLFERVLICSQQIRERCTPLLQQLLEKVQQRTKATTISTALHAGDAVVGPAAAPAPVLPIVLPAVAVAPIIVSVPTVLNHTTGPSTQQKTSESALCVQEICTTCLSKNVMLI